MTPSGIEPATFQRSASANCATAYPLENKECIIITHACEFLLVNFEATDTFLWKWENILHSDLLSFFTLVLFIRSFLVFIAFFLHLLRCIFFHFSFLYFYLFTLSCFRPLLPAHSPHFNSSSSTFPTPLQRPHGTVVLSWAERAPIFQPECQAHIQTVIVLRFLTVLKADPTQLTNLC